MPYAISSSRKRFEIQLDEIKKKLKIADKRGVSTDLRDYAIAAAIFLAHAEVENYFVDVLGSIAVAYSSAAADASRLPARLRAHLVVEKFNLQSIAAKFSIRTGEPDILSAIENWFSSSMVCLLNESKPLAPFDGNDIHGDYGYPSTKNIERVLRRIGIGDPKGVLNREAKRDVVGRLESVGNLRTALAHNASLPGISCADVIAHLNGLKMFARALDRVLYAHLRQALPHTVWKASLC
ncbi:MAG: hypothetical protein J0H48_09325 [Nitrosospira multiformis]|nr:hypothetical protein [Nitrosospira multiformis]